jgi:hypothetical protein
MKFWCDERGSTLTLVANKAAIVAFAAIVVALLLDHVTQNGQGPLIAALQPSGIHSADSRMAGIDMTPTGSIGTVVLDPCTGQQK